MGYNKIINQKEKTDHNYQHLFYKIKSIQTTLQVVLKPFIGYSPYAI
jgi:hypothetical protein